MSSDDKPRLLIVGKLPPPYFGPAIATQIILNSKLKDEYSLFHLNNAINASIQTMGQGSFRKVFMNLRIYYRMFQLLLRVKPHIVLIPISQTSSGFIKDSVLIWIASMFKNRIVLQLRGSNFRNWQAQSGSLMKWFTHQTCNRADRVIVLGESLKYLFEGYFPAEKICVVPNGADYEIPSIQKPKGKTKAIFLANMLDSKGIRDVISAMVLLEQEIPGQVELDVVGTWGSVEVQQFCERIVAENNLNVCFHAPLDGRSKLEMLARADIFVFPPREPEGHPWVIVEAMACGLPIISTDMGAIRESVIDSDNGFIVEVRSPGAIAFRLKQLTQDADMRQRMGRRSRELYEAKFTEERMVERLKAVFGR